MNFNIKYYNKRWYKALTVLMVIALIITITFVPVQRARAVGVLTVSLAAVIIAAMAGAGIYTVVAGLTFSDVQDWINDKLEEWDTYRNDGHSWYDLLIENNNITATVRGFLKVEYDLATNIYKFIEWLINDNLNMSSNETSQVITNSGIFNLNQYFNITGSNTYGVSHNTLYCGGQNNNWNSITLNKIGNYSQKIEFDVSFYTTRPTTNNSWGYFIALGPNSPNNATYSNLVNCTLDEGNYPKPNNNLTTCSGSYHFYSSASNSVSFTAYSTSTLSVTITNLYINDAPVEEAGGSSLTVGTNTVIIPDVDTSNEGVILNPGISDTQTTVEGITTGIVEGVNTNTLDVTTTTESEYVDAQEVVLINSQPISVDTDHHLFGFQLPDFDFDFQSIWHYVTDAIEYAEDWIDWFVAMIAAVPVLAIPLYMAFTLIVIISFIKRVIL